MFEHAFELLAAFDEIVALGYKENVNLAQIRTYTEMDSHDERVHDAMRLVSWLWKCDAPRSRLSLSRSVKNVKRRIR